MDDSRFDLWARVLGNRPSASRRELIGILMGAALVTLVGGDAIAKGKKKKKKKKSKNTPVIEGPCGSNQQLCNGSCRDLHTDFGHCGMCNHPCFSGEVCSGGICRPGCPSGIACNTFCCNNGETCQQGICGRPGPPPPPSPPSPPPPPQSESDPYCWSEPNLTFGGSRRWAQTFISNTSTSIAGFECLVETSTEDDEFTLELRTLGAGGVPSNTVVAAATVIVEQDGQTQLLGSFGEAVELDAGNGYAFVITLIDGNVLTPRGRNGNICPQQRLYFDASATGNFVLHDTAYDMIFASLFIN